jgi:N-methylhydantoinase A
MSGYLNRLQRAFTELGYTRPIHLMTSGGSLASLETAAQFPVRLSRVWARRRRHPGRSHRARARGSPHPLLRHGRHHRQDLLIDNGQPLKGRAFEVDRQSRFKKGSGTPLRIPVIEMVEIGAGGGSIARVDTLQRIQVGPDSAGAEPGPRLLRPRRPRADRHRRRRHHRQDRHRALRRRQDRHPP